MDREAPAHERLGPALRIEADVAHLHQAEDPALVGELRKRMPTLLSVHGYPACTSQVYYFAPGQQCTRAHGPGCVPNLALRGCAHMRDPRYLPTTYRQAGRAVSALRDCDLAISYSSAVDRHLAANGIAPRRIVPLFTTVPPVSGSGHQDRRRVVFAGRLVAPKGVDTLIRAARELPDADFVICGDGWDMRRLRRLASHLEVSERVRFRGWLAPEELARELADASVVAIPSLWPEPFGLVGIEAQARGRPAVAYRVGGIAEWIGDAGLAVERDDQAALATAIRKVFDQAAWPVFSLAAWRRAEAYRLPAHVDRFLELCDAA
jgi:glycosyltransferase involved in cell wall biosynthesis